MFDGRKYARKREEALKKKIESLDRNLLMVSVLVGDDESSELYTKMKKECADRVGVGFEIERVGGDVSVDELCKVVERISLCDDIDGVMVQLPLPGDLKNKVDDIVHVISLEKDVDGMRWKESGVMSATVRAVFSILECCVGCCDSSGGGSVDGGCGGDGFCCCSGEYGCKSGCHADLWDGKFVVVGKDGSVGKAMFGFLEKKGVDVVGVGSSDGLEKVREADVVISCVGKSGLIDESDVKDGVVVVDVGIDMVDGKAVGDMTNGVYEKAKIAVPVPGGVGPVTIVSLMENLVDMVK